MSSQTRSRRRKAKRSLPVVDADVVQRHLAAYFYAAYSNCDCEACKLLRPLAKEMLERLKKSGKVMQSG